MSSLNRIIELFRKFPGIGPRQAERFAYFLMAQNESYVKELMREMELLKTGSSLCSSCFRYFARNGGGSTTCPICTNPDRDHSKLMIVSYTMDMENIERSKAYDGMYFILGGTVPVLEKEPEKRVRTTELVKRLENNNQIEEVILAMNATTEGENTSEFVEGKLKPWKEKGLKISHLGRGLSTGSELEYSDGDTITAALKNRT